MESMAGSGVDLIELIKPLINLIIQDFHRKNKTKDKRPRRTGAVHFFYSPTSAPIV